MARPPPPVPPQQARAMTWLQHLLDDIPSDSVPGLCLRYTEISTFPFRRRDLRKAHRTRHAGLSPMPSIEMTKNCSNGGKKFASASREVPALHKSHTRDISRQTQPYRTLFLARGLLVSSAMTFVLRFQGFASPRP